MVMKLSTTNEIQIVTGKTLKLNHVLSRRIDGSDMDEFQKISHMFESYAKVHHLTLYGPAILHTISELKDGAVSQNMELLGQVREIPSKVLPPYTFTELLRVENCLMARYHGAMDKLALAYQKLDIYCFENDISVKHEVYTVIFEEKENIISADIFAEVDV